MFIFLLMITVYNIVYLTLSGTPHEVGSVCLVTGSLRFMDLQLGNISCDLKIS